MPTYKDKDQDRNTWHSRFSYKDWTVKMRSKTKRGFKTKKEAHTFESQFKLKQSNEIDMLVSDFYSIYLEYCVRRLKLNIVKIKMHIFETKNLPFFENKKMNEITPAMVTAWQNIILDERTVGIGVFDDFAEVSKIVDAGATTKK